MGLFNNNPVVGSAVVDPLLNVWGVSNLMVADPSICPTPPKANAGLVSLIIAERAASILLSGI
jgi:choline dehydrogenase-like flavoprotein